MISVITSYEVLEETHVLAEAILTSEIYEHYQSCRKQLTIDMDAQSLIQRFSRMKDEYEEIQRFGKYHPDFKQKSKEMRELKRELDLHPVISNYKKAETNLEKLLNEISQIIAHEVSPQIKVPSGNPFFDGMGCSSGGCGSGGSCGCK